MKKKQLQGSSGRAEPQPATNPKTANSITNDPGIAQAPAALGPNASLSAIGVKERATLEDIAAALSGTDLDGLPQEPRGDTIRGLFWAIEALTSPVVEAREQHCVPFHARLSNREAELGRAAIEEIWVITSCALVGLTYLTARGCVNGRGVELPACWSPGDLDGSICSMRDALTRLTALNGKLCQLRYGEPAPESAKTSTLAQSPDSDLPGAK
jgi:hypothetical protein